MDQANRGGFSTRTFIIGQVLTIASTVIGVYLAGYVGFERTLEYDRFKRAQAQVQVMSAFEAELVDNLDRLDAFVEAMDPSGASRLYANDWPSLRLYAWRAGAESPALFDLPGPVLTEMQAFYDETARILADPRMRELYQTSSGSDAFARNQYKMQLQERLARAREAALTPLRAAQDAPQAVLQAYGEE